MRAADLAPVADRLYALAPAHFISARTEATAQAKQAGDAELAAAIKRLPKPSSGAWLVNALAREPGRLDDLLTLGADLRAAQAALDGDELRRLSRQRHQTIRDLLAVAADIAEEAGSTLADPTARAVAATLEAAAADEDAAHAVRTGRLVRVLTSTGFEPVDLAGAVAVPDGASAVSDGADAVSDGAGAVSDGAGAVSDGPRAVTAGARTVTGRARPTLRAVAPLPAGKPERTNAAQRALAEASEYSAHAERALILAGSALESITEGVERAEANVQTAEQALADARAELAALEKDRVGAGRDRDAASRRRDSARRLLAKAQAAVGRSD